MKIDELIKELEQVKEKHGNLNILVTNIIEDETTRDMLNSEIMNTKNSPTEWDKIVVLSNEKFN